MQQSKALFIGLWSDQLVFLGRPRGDKRTVPRGARRCGDRLVSQHHVHLPSLLNRIVRSHRATLDSPSTPEEACGGAAPGSGLSASPCCARCLCRELSVPSPAVVAPLAAAAAAAAPVPVSGMLSISEERRKMKIFSGKLCNGIASQEEGKAWV